LDKELSVTFMGYIDKIMYYKNIEDIYFSIIDYKTGTIDTHIEPMKYGLHMQLPVYLYLIHYSKVFTSPIFTGIYYQNILFNYPKYSNTLEKEEQTKYYLQGYSTDNINNLSIFDSTYEDSHMIRGMKYTDKFGQYAKLITDDEVYNLVKYTKKIIDTDVDDIIKGDFTINPKIYNGKNVSCEYCKFKDLCYSTSDDNIYLDKVEDLSFLTDSAGGEE
jgi:ATP-dependent helicase/nuclease subunit B